MLKTETILSFINRDKQSKKKRESRVGKRYYDGIHDILDYRIFYVDDTGNLVEDTNRSNIKIPHAFFTEIVDQKGQYILSNKDKIIKSDDPLLQKKLDASFDDDFREQLLELISNSSKKGFDYIYAIKNKDNVFNFKEADGLHVIEVEAKNNGDDNDDNDYIIYYYVDEIMETKGFKEITKVEVWDKTQTYYYIKENSKTLTEDKSQKINPRPHVVYKENDTLYGNGFDFLPFFRLDNNNEQSSDLKPIKSLIDDYDLMACGLSNNLQDMAEGVYVVKGFMGSDLTELQKNIKTKKIVGVDEGGDIDIRTINIPYEARKIKLELDELNIYRFGMALNSHQIGDGNITNIVIKSRYALLDLKCNKTEIRLRKLLSKLVKIVLDDINKEEETSYTLENVYFDLSREIIVNELDNANIKKTEAERKKIEIETMLELSQYVGDEKVLEMICEILDIDYEEVKDNLSTLQLAKTDLNNASENLLTVGTTSQQAENEAQQVTGKSLNGAQTQSLLIVMEQLADGKLTENQAVNIISTAIGITKDEARAIIKGLE